MNKRSGLAVAAAVLAMSFGSSAFAESRHSGGTRGGSRGGSRGSHPSYSRPSGSSRSYRAPAPSYRGSSNRGQSYRGPTYRGGSYNDGHRFYGQGRIERVVPYRGGYHVYLGGWRYPYFVPYRYYSPFRYRIGLFIGFNAFYDPLGYYSVYGWPGYYGYGYYGPPPVYRGGYDDRDDDSNASLRGTVESVDLQTGFVVIDDSGSNRKYTALLPPRDNRVDTIRPGDYIELSGEWVRGRRYDFDADRMDRLDTARR